MHGRNLENAGRIAYRIGRRGLVLCLTNDANTYISRRAKQPDNDGHSCYMIVTDRINCRPYNQLFFYYRSTILHRRDFILIKEQEAQLLPKNRASAMHFFVAKLLSIAVMTYTYVYHLRNLRPMIRLICYAHSE